MGWVEDAVFDDDENEADEEVEGVYILIERKAETTFRAVFVFADDVFVCLLSSPMG